ncbi:elongation factor 4 [Candidatus Campbellbacteria bacterium]|nr:MAG: elongation factor 4 [Candidatus Campbellbacteria bacterium]
MHSRLIRNFSIIAHIDHGKSTLADRMLEVTHTIEKRKMREQVLDSMDLERERGITIKMAPVRMDFATGGEKYVLNLIDTPGHIDFSYEVSRALKAVEGTLLLVDATQGVQAQTLTTLAMAREQGLAIIPVLSKIDSPLARVDDIALEIIEILDCDPESIMKVSGRTGEGVEALLQEIVKRVPPPTQETGESLQALVFDFTYSNHRGIIVHTRIMNGRVSAKDRLLFSAAREECFAGEVGVFTPQEHAMESLGPGEIGYIVTGIKKPGIASVGDTLTKPKDPAEPLHGYQQPRPVVWASIFPEGQDDFALLRQALERLRLSDSSLSYEEEASGTLGRGFRCGFLGMLHLEIVTERLRRESNLSLVVTTPSITYEVTYKNGETEMIYSPAFFPDYGTAVRIREPWVAVHLITPSEYMNAIMQLLYDHEASLQDSRTFRDGRISLSITMPLRELMRGFFDAIKSVTAGYASLSYELTDMKDADVLRLDILVADDVVTAFSRVVSHRTLEEEARKAVEKLAAALPRQLFVTKIQARAKGRIIASETLKAMRKDVTGYLYGGDITRKMKLLEKQKRGKKKMLKNAKVNIPHEVFLKMVKE